MQREKEAAAKREGIYTGKNRFKKTITFTENEGYFYRKLGISVVRRR